MGAATWPPLPPRSTRTTTTTSGSCAGAKEANQAWSCPLALSLLATLCAVPVLPAISTPGMRAAAPVPPSLPTPDPAVGGGSHQARPPQGRQEQLPRAGGHVDGAPRLPAAAIAAPPAVEERDQ